MAAKKDRTQVRVLADALIDGVSYRSNQRVTFPADLAQQLKDAGLVDDHKDALAYCATLGAAAIDHTGA
ncbi:hypothetical protein [Pseudomonas paeninsulae]|uniref:hypothetical protein n=1 Tax=Pseudomonas paeninsulae TaxID=3110772 RepID=UPI002D7663F5|nr:hypothetical protein [Pseudomonas sp. IT1137]